MRSTLVFLALFAACVGPETGIDTSVLVGTVRIPAASVAEVDTRGSANNTVATAQPVGPDGSTGLTWRATWIGGVTKSFDPSGVGARFGDPDHYAFRPVADGAFTFELSFAGGTARRSPPPPLDTGAPADTATDTGDTSSDTGVPADTAGDTSGEDTGVVPTDTGALPTYTDPVVFAVEVYDAASYDPDTGAGLVYAGTTDGTGGTFTATVELASGTDYVLLVGGLVAPNPGDQVPYTLKLGGNEPSSAPILVGAYAGNDASIAEPPLGGATVTEWTYDAVDGSWTGSYRIDGIRSVVVPALDSGADPDLLPDPEVTEGAAVVYLRAATLPALNASPAAGALYTTTSIEAAPNGGEFEVAAPILMDGVFPKVIGLTVAEEPSEGVVAEDGTLDMTTLVAQEIGVASGLGYVDVFDGSIEFDPTVEAWEGNDADFYAFTVAEPLLARMTVVWPTATFDIDAGVFGDTTGYGDYGVIDWFQFSAASCMTGDDPEVCTLELALDPALTYYVGVLGYAGEGTEPYHLELEWVAP